MKWIDRLKDLFWHPCPACENWTTEKSYYYFENIKDADNKLFHCYNCGIWFREG